jgi:hypothetical protein
MTIRVATRSAGEALGEADGLGGAVSEGPGIDTDGSGEATGGELGEGPGSTATVGVK